MSGSIQEGRELQAIPGCDGTDVSNEGGGVLGGVVGKMQEEIFEAFNAESPKRDLGESLASNRVHVLASNRVHVLASQICRYIQKTLFGECLEKVPDSCIPKILKMPIPAETIQEIVKNDKKYGIGGKNKYF